jgi:hypothetical protein
MVLRFSERATVGDREAEGEGGEREMRKSGNPAHLFLVIDFFSLTFP